MDFTLLCYSFFSFNALVISCCCALLGILDYYSNATYWNDEQNTPHPWRFLLSVRLIEGCTERRCVFGPLGN